MPEPSAASLRVSDDPGLEGIQLPALKRTGRSTITGNENLTALDVSALSEAAGIEIFDNPSLDASDLTDALDLPSAKLGRNAGDAPAPLDPCPWAGDFQCDEVGFGGSELCAAATDTGDCGAID